MRASVPVRTCDIGGWTDTWFGGPGRVLNVAVAPGVEVTLWSTEPPQKGHGHGLIDAALDNYPPPVPVRVDVRSAIPAGSSLGTSSALAVALVGALCALRGEGLTPSAVARAAHQLETVALGGECGVQDQLCAAYGGISYISVDGYPHASVESLPAWEELDESMTTIYLGRPHVSTDVHREVIERGDHGVLDRLRGAAERAKAAVMKHDLVELGAAMQDNTAAQRDLHPSIVGADAEAVIALARSSGACGWKVNGAGGDGGSVVVLHRGASERETFGGRVAKTDRWRVLPLHLSSSGLVVEAG